MDDLEQQRHDYASDDGRIHAAEIPSSSHFAAGQRSGTDMSFFAGATGLPHDSHQGCYSWDDFAAGVKYGKKTRKRLTSNPTCETVTTMSKSKESAPSPATEQDCSSKDLACQNGNHTGLKPTGICKHEKHVGPMELNRCESCGEDVWLAKSCK